MKVCYVSDMKHDVEGWIAYYVLQDAGYEIMSCYDIDIKGSFLKLWFSKPDFPFPVILCTHSSPYGIMVRVPDITWDHEIFLQDNPEVHRLFTCFLDYETQKATPFINLPGYDELGCPGYWMVKTKAASDYYRHWLGNLKARWKPGVNVSELYDQIVMPRLRKYFRRSGTPWLFRRIFILVT